MANAKIEERTKSVCVKLNGKVFCYSNSTSTSSLLLHCCSEKDKPTTMLTKSHTNLCRCQRKNQSIFFYFSHSFASAVFSFCLISSSYSLGLVLRVLCICVCFRNYRVPFGDYLRLLHLNVLITATSLQTPIFHHN